MNDEHQIRRRRFVLPRVVLSQCLELEACRHDGQRIRNSFVSRLVEFVDIVPICPEVEIGLGTPREAVRLIDDAGTTKFVQPATERDLTEPMTRFSSAFLDGLGDVDGFVLKSGSPSCGTGSVKVYQRAERSPPVRTEPGFFARHVQDRLGHLAIEDEGRLRNYYIRHHFLTQLFAFSELRRLGDDVSMAAIIDFHRRHKHLLMLYDEPALRRLGRIVANDDDAHPEVVYRQYAEDFRKALDEAPNRKTHTNVLQHLYGHFKHQISDAERRDFLQMLDELRHHQVTLSAPLSVIRSWCARFDNQYLADQSYLQPYPRGLYQMRDSGKGFDF